jgi:hypothetical protein
VPLFGPGGLPVPRGDQRGRTPGSKEGVSTVKLTKPAVTIEVMSVLRLMTRPPTARPKLPRAITPKTPPGPPGVVGGVSPDKLMTLRGLMLVHMFITTVTRPVAWSTDL